MVRRFLLGLKRVVLRVPIYGQLVEVRGRSFRDGFKELLVATIFSLLPLWLYPLLLATLSDQPFGDAVHSSIVRGELYLYSAALVGPLIYSVNKSYGLGVDTTSEQTDSGHNRLSNIMSLRFPYTGLFSVISVLVCTLAAAFYAWMRADEQGIMSLPLNESRTLGLSLYLYIFTLSCMFCVLVYRLDLEDVATRLRDDPDDLLDQWRKRT